MYYNESWAVGSTSPSALPCLDLPDLRHFSGLLLHHYVMDYDNDHDTYA